MKIWNFLKSNIYVKNIFWAVLIIIVLIFGLKWGLNNYTRHGQAIVAPDVRGLSVKEAAVFFHNNQLNYEVIDSIYDRNVKPGVIVETVPKAGTKVKEHRNIYITINASTAFAAIVPEVKDQSLRQAIAKLNAAEFKNIQVKYVLNAYRDLVLGLEYKGRAVKAGERLPIESRLVLLVSNGARDSEEFYNDSIESNGDVSVDESWLN